MAISNTTFGRVSVGYQAGFTSNAHYDTVMMRVLKYRLYPNRRQIERLTHFLDVGRTLYNHSLKQRIAHYCEQNQPLMRFSQERDLTQLRSMSLVLADVPVWIERDVFYRLDAAFSNFYRRTLGGERKTGFPRFKKEARWNQFSIRMPRSVLHSENLVRIPGLVNMVRARGVRQPQGVVKQLRIVRRAGKWYAHLLIDNGLSAPARLPIHSAIGIDVGIASFATLSNGEKIPNPRFGQKLAKKLVRANRTMRRKKRDSRNRFKAARLLRGRLAKVIRDAAWGQFRFQLRYKAESAGVHLAEIEAFGTSQQCSACGTLVLKELSIRVHSCASCGLTIDRDHNAALNILARATGGRPDDACGAVYRPL